MSSRSFSFSDSATSPEQRSLLSALSLRAKVSLGALLPLLLILGMFSTIDYFRRREVILQDLSSLASYTGQLVDDTLRHQMLTSDFDGLQGLLDTIGGNDQFETLYLLDIEGEVIFAPNEVDVGLRLDNQHPECQGCHLFAPDERPESVVLRTSNGQILFRSMEPIENDTECTECHDAEQSLIGLLLIDMPVVPFSDSLATYLREHVLWWLALILLTLLVVNLVLQRFVLSRLGRFAAAISRFGRDQEQVILSDDAGDEIGKLAQAFNDMSRQVEMRSAQNQELSDNLRRQSLLRGELLKRLITAQEDERIRVARELHDGLGQTLSGLAMRVSVVERYLNADRDDAVEHLGTIRTLIAETTDQMYDIILDLRPSALDDLGLVPAIRAYAERLSPEAELDFKLETGDFKRRLTSEIETALFRIIQEALTNTVRHASASWVTVNLDCGEHQIICRIADNGKGFDVKSIQTNGHGPRGLGLLGMQERAQHCGGSLSISSEPGVGTLIHVRIPTEDGCYD